MPERLQSEDAGRGLWSVGFTLWHLAGDLLWRLMRLRLIEGLWIVLCGVWVGGAFVRLWV